MTSATAATQAVKEEGKGTSAESEESTILFLIVNFLVSEQV
jgi:hypothetical protein